MERIGYLKAPIATEQFTHTQKILLSHGAQLHKANRDPADTWWVIILPDGTTREKQEPHSSVPKYQILLPDGFAFDFEAGTLNQHGLFTRAPAIFLDLSEEAETKMSGIS